MKNTWLQGDHHIFFLHANRPIFLHILLQILFFKLSEWPWRLSLWNSNLDVLLGFQTICINYKKTIISDPVEIVQLFISWMVKASTARTGSKGQTVIYDCSSRHPHTLSSIQRYVENSFLAAHSQEALLSSLVKPRAPQTLQRLRLSFFSVACMQICSHCQLGFVTGFARSRLWECLLIKKKCTGVPHNTHIIIIITDS